MTSIGDEEHDRTQDPIRLRSRALTQWPLLTVLGVLCFGSGVAVTGHWRWASFILGCGVSLAAFWRLVLPGRVAGLLVVRTRVFDVIFTSVMAIGIIALTLIVPPMRPR